MNKKLLAVNQYKSEIIDALVNNPVVVIEAPTGSGKTTQIPQILFNSELINFGQIGVTQPRRIAAYGVANRIAYEMNVELGELVGYKMRFDDKTSSDTKIKIMTDGILLEELRSDPLLSKYSVIMVDEAHERSLNIDFILGLLKDILEQRNDLKIVVSSATINTKVFSDFFDNAPIISVETTSYPVDIKYIKLEKNRDTDVVEKKIIEIIDGLEEKKIKGDVLIFLPGEHSIKNCCKNLEILNSNKHYSLAVLPLYARLSHEEQKRVFDDFPNKRKVIIATNIAETSITIDGVIHVIDPGISKLNYYNPRTFTSFLESKPISKASAAQRMGRAGRTAPGIVYRLYTEKDFLSREEYTKEQIYRTDLSEVVLRMADLGIAHYTEFHFISPPRKGAIFSAIDTLITIGALNDNQQLTDIGKQMVSFPLGPRLSRILLEALLNYPDVVYDILIIISFLSAKTPFLYPHGEEIESRNAQRTFFVKEGDFFSWINLFYKFMRAGNKEEFCTKYYLDLRGIKEIANVHSQLIDMITKLGYDIGNSFNYEKIIICLCTGLRQFICKSDAKKRNAYFSATERDIRIHPGSYLFGKTPGWIIGGEIVNTGRTYIRSGAVISHEIVKNDFLGIFSSICGKAENKKKYISTEVTKKGKKPFENDNRIYILDKYFDVYKENKSRFLNVPYSIIIQLRNRKKEILQKDYGELKAKLIFKDKIILKDSLNSLLRYFDKIDLDNGINKRWPKNQVFLYPEDWISMLRNMNLILKPTLFKKSSKQTGFLCLGSYDKDSYHYYLENDFFYALEVSLESFEKLFDSEVKAWNNKEESMMVDVYNKLLNLSEEMES